ncbi:MULTISPECIES: metallophosphoesterase family protein [Thermodesulfobacterium]|jgi:serine/threonine protein phosphatase 1|uniref:Metallophosphatase n=2 Tax=Thermodesulfobacterium commune TaxID=1741 RepID=A0A075WT35_9BACT|nr:MULTISPECIES: metallophosphoesterase family protein [Thermodesulfobacterium]KUJ98240.1 MAG: Metallophosphoesterase [Thermodesulfobacterium sp. 37_54]KUK19498.1 MAG: Metallophosphoesterase [Thermodesulfobacterium commune]AIH04031.1 metallophosphatase [Thermodesulfobacterium commune DSM 2178]KUK37792.1 MAG: Metallophosphoesterase [Thermodesulfobacterium commune]MBZ4681407.1 metallophosphatase [Thermodesulfobacterium sp.]
MYEGLKIFAVGDIHGCLESLEALLEILPINWGKDLLIFLGDYIDRGENPRGVVEKIITLKKKYPEHVITLKGNHELMFEWFLEGKNVELFFYNGGEVTISQYYNSEKRMVELPLEHQIFFQELRLFFECEDYLFVHAGINPYKSLKDQTEEDFLWIRGLFYESKKVLPKTVVFGHTPFPTPFLGPDRIGIDTGCVYGGFLTAVMLPDIKFFQVKCKSRR